MKRFIVFALVGATLLTGAVALAAGAATRSAADCNPAYQYCNPGLLPAGVYTTRYFVPGMKVTVPAGGWQSSQDSAIEFRLFPPGYAPTDSSPAIRFWIDPHVSTPCSDKLVPVDITTPARAVRWLRHNKNLIVSAPRRTTIAGHIPALSVDLDDSPTAPRCDPACSGPCIDYFLFRAPGVSTEPYGSGRGELVRLYFATIRKPSHLFVAGVDTPNNNKKVFATLTASLTKMLAHLRLPAKLPPKRS